MKNRRSDRRADLVRISGGFCVSCGSTYELQFDHIDPRTKLFLISGSNLDKPWANLLKELSKCQLMCAPCHIKKTRDNGEFGGGHNKYEPVCGTAHCYSVTGCRCDKCIKAKRLYREKKIEYGQSIADYLI